MSPFIITTLSEIPGRSIKNVFGLVTSEHLHFISSDKKKHREAFGQQVMKEFPEANAVVGVTSVGSQGMFMYIGTAVKLG